MTRPTGTSIGFDLVIRRGMIVTADAEFRADIGVRSETITAIGTELPVGQDEIDADGCYVLPGLVDVHTHFDAVMHGSRSPDDFYHGTASAACGGVTTIVDYAKGAPGEHPEAVIENYHSRAEGNSVIDYGFSPIIFNTSKEIWASLPRIIAAGCPTLKVFMTYEFRLSEVELLHMVELVNTHGGLLCVHAEDGTAIDYLASRFLTTGRTAPRYHAMSRPPETERDAVLRITQLVRLTGAGPVFIVHLSSAAALGAVQMARAEGLPVICETCPRYLSFTADRYEQPFEIAARYVVSPPLRSPEDQRALLEGLRNGSISVVASDHIVFLDSDKARGRDDFSQIPNGAPGVETMLATVHTLGPTAGQFDLTRLVAVLSTNPAKLFGLWPKKGTLAVGSDADIVVFDPRKRFVVRHTELHSRCDHALDEGHEWIGMPVATISRGEVIYKEGQFLGQRGRGRFLVRRGPRMV